ncbi:glycerol-3-phosphate dehydrogenase/oxidase [Microbacterium mcarthurae (nom. nud.)]|uniref:Glycerol-3-phosphate dehydrogenase/oxidase n=1 Tax=Microbacterium mcarthurae TaxID=3035918 RepID=A0ABW9GGP0_9MICO
MDKVDHPAFDIVIIGAGINGLGIARDAAERGLSVALVEQEDVCAGVSAWSGRLVHGGLRYLERGDIRLVRESLRERELLFKVAPHLVKPVRLIMPFYARNTRPSWMIRLGMLAYDVLSVDKSVAWHRVLSASGVRERFRGAARDGLSGAALFTDGQVEYAERLCVELAVAAVDAGARLFLHTRAIGLLGSGKRVTGVRVQHADGSVADIHGRLTINAGGPWVDAVLRGDEASSALPGIPAPRLIGGAKGSHIIVDPFPGAPSDVVYYESQTDGRLVLVIPWMGRYLIGCTDTKFDLDPDEARAETDEIEYLLTETNALVPGANLTADDVLYTYSGVRPLPYAPDVPEWKVPRSHIVRDHAKDGHPGLLSIVGGKLTTYRQLAEDATDAAVKRLRAGLKRPVSKHQPFPGARAADLGAFEKALLSTNLVERDTAERLWALYGTRAERVLDLVRERPTLAERFDPESPAIAAELVFAMRIEFAETFTDVFARRLLLAFEPKHGVRGVERAADILADERGWDADRRGAEIAGYRRWLDHLRVPVRAAQPA